MQLSEIFTITLKNHKWNQHNCKITLVCHSTSVRR